MLFNPRSRSTARLAAGSVLAATALASGAFAVIGTSVAHADAASGQYTNGNQLTWDATGTATTDTLDVADLPDADSSMASMSLTLLNVHVPAVSGLHVTLTGPNGAAEQLLSNPASVVGATALNGANVTFSSDGSGQPSSPGTLADEVGQPGSPAWTLSVSDDNGDAGSIGSWKLTFTYQPFTTGPLEDQTVPSGTNATFTAPVSAVPAPGVQWQYSTDSGTTWTNIVGATFSSYTVTAPTTAQSGTLYRAEAGNVAGSVTTNAAQLTVDGTTPTIMQQPQGETVRAGNPVTFTASASGDPGVTSVQWEQSTDKGLDWSPIDGATSDSYTLPYMPTLADNNTLFHVVYTNDIGSTTSNAAKLTVDGTLPSQPRNVTASQTGPGTITVHWAAPASAGVPATLLGYNPGYAATDFGNGESVAASRLSDTFKGLLPGKYHASVTAFNAAGDSVRVFVPVTVVAPTATPVAHASATRVTAGHKFVLSGTGPKTATLTIQRALPGKSFVKLTTVKTNSWGAYSIAIPVVHTAAYRVVTSAGKVSNKVTVVAPYAVHVRTIRTAVRAYTIKGWITPAAAGRTVHITATVAGKLVRIATVTTSSTGSYKTHYKFAKKGPVTVHVHVSSSVLNAAGSTSKALMVS